MKILAGLLLFVLLGAAAYGQQGSGAKIMAETSVMSEKIVKGSPFSADAVNESVQMLADGNRIVRTSTNKLYRNSEGRFRREISGSSGGSMSTFFSVGPGITILDPVQGYRYLLDSHLKTARMGTLAGPSVVTTVQGAVKVTPAQSAMIDKMKAAEQRASEAIRAVAAPVAVVTAKEKVYAEVATTVAQGGTGTHVFTPSAATKYESRTEELGVQNIEGVEANGTRTITTIPAGEIGNERPIEIVYEKWYSNDLQLVVMSKHSDPRFGEQTYRLTNIQRSEPDASLFELPHGYRLLTEPAGTYTISTGKGDEGRLIYARPPKPPTAPVIKATKP